MPLRPSTESQESHVACRRNFQVSANIYAVTYALVNDINFIRRASRRWALLTDKEKKPWNQLAEQDKQAHKEAFPNYKYCPRRSNSAAFFSKPTIIPVRELTGSSGPTYSKSTDHSDRKVDLDLDNIARRRLMRK